VEKTKDLMIPLKTAGDLDVFVREDGTVEVHADDGRTSVRVVLGAEEAAMMGDFLKTGILPEKEK